MMARIVPGFGGNTTNVACIAEASMLLDD